MKRGNGKCIIDGVRVCYNVEMFQRLLVSQISRTAT